MVVNYKKKKKEREKKDLSKSRVNFFSVVGDNILLRR